MIAFVISLLFLVGTLGERTIVYKTHAVRGNIGNRQEANALCASISGYTEACASYWAIITYNGENIEQFPIPITQDVVTSGGVIVASGWTSDVLNITWHTYYGKCWTGMDSNGNAYVDGNCANWQSQQNCGVGGSILWYTLGSAVLDCNRMYPILCACVGATDVPTQSPSWSPSKSPTTSSPSKSPSTSSPSKSPTTSTPSKSPTTSTPSKSPTTSAPSKIPTLSPTHNPAFIHPTQSPTFPTILEGTGRVVDSFQGESVAVSNGNTWVAVGGPGDNSDIGAVWFYKQASPGTWSQVGSKTVAPSPTTGFGSAVALDSAATAIIIGAGGESSNHGAVYYFSRSGDTRTYVSRMTDPVGRVGDTIRLGEVVAVSDDGNTFVAGAQGDSSNKGAAYVYIKSGGSYTLQARLQGSVSSSTAEQGASVTISGDGNTVAIVGFNDGGGVGATWVFTRSGVTWTEVAKLVGTGYSGTPFQAEGCLSTDGLTLAVGGPNDNSGVGAVWIFVNSGGTWTQQGSKLVGTGATGNANQGRSVYLSSDGNKLVVGGSADNSNVGAVWVWLRSGSIWTQLALLDGGLTGSNGLGYRTAMSSDGTIILAGTPFRVVTGTPNAGGAVLFQSL